jgi:putative selenate reductase
VHFSIWTLRMSDRFQPISMQQLAGWIFGELNAHNSVFGIPRELFFVPKAGDPFAQRVYGQPLETPFGVAAGPHSQMAQNIVVAWLCGARFIELKTVQTLDELHVSKPCIDMQDEGYNVEWSQELKVHESFDEYVRAWVLIHALHRRLGFPGDRPGVIFNMSVGYNLEGLLKPNMQWFLRAMRDAGAMKRQYVELLSTLCPEVRGVEIPDRLSDNVTLSTMHGCPPDEIGRISRHLMEECGLHTSVKLNPTLLGPDRVRDILNNRLGYFDVTVPDAAFGHDLKYADAIPMLRELRQVAEDRGLVFGVKLSNTLEVVNHRTVFAEQEKMMYLSGRPLHALTVNLAATLAEEFKGALPISFAGGADAFNVVKLLEGGISTITSCSDLLRSGGYTRMLQYTENVREALAARGARTLQDLAAGRALENLKAYAGDVLKDRQWRKDTFRRERTKTARALGLFDCIEAPCVDECPINQKVPQYMNLVRDGRFEEAVDITREDNPLPAILGRACNHLCECTCVRTHYDEPLAIREIKRFIMEQEKKPRPRPRARARDARVAVVGGGPCGLSVAYFLCQAGYAVTVFEARAYAGGMVSGTIPGYRATLSAVLQDMKVIERLGVEIRYNQAAGRDFLWADLKRQGFKYFVIAAGAQRGARLGIPGEEAAGVYDALEFLRASREGHPLPLGRRVGVIGGGDVAMDCARTAWRLGGREVQVLYRRTRREMPAEPEEVRGLLEEGIGLSELTAPKRVVARDGHLVALECIRMRLGEPDETGRRRPVEQSGSEFETPLDNLIVAISQTADLKFFGDDAPALTRGGFIRVDAQTLETSLPNVFAGGDIGPSGPSSIVRAAGDGRRIAGSIRRREEGDRSSARAPWPEVNVTDLLRWRSRREYRVNIPDRPVAERGNFEEVLQTLSEKDARREAARCLDCHLLCSYCAGVCPNLAIATYRTRPFEAELPLYELRDGIPVPRGTETFRVDQPFQVAVLTDFCNECGNCVAFCPTAGQPYREKPRMYLRQSEFDAEADNAFMIFRDEGAWCMEGKFGGLVHEIILNHEVHYVSPDAVARLDPRSLRVLDLKASPRAGGSDTISLRRAAEMLALLRGISESMPYFPVADKAGGA